VQAPVLPKKKKTGNSDFVEIKKFCMTLITLNRVKKKNDIQGENIFHT
jgi:hypothetical protein